MTDAPNLEFAQGKMLAQAEGPIGWILFNTPARRNAVSLDMWAAIPEILRHFEAQPSIRVIVLRGAGNEAFVAGADISEFEQARATPEANAAYERAFTDANDHLHACSKPTIAMIRGWCMGGGVGIAVSCDLRIAAEDAKFGIPAARLGVGYGHTGVKKLLDLVGPSFAKEIFFTGRHFSAAEALSMGLVNRLLPGADLEAYVRRYCAMIAENAPLTIHAVKRTVNELLKGAKGDLASTERLVTACFQSQDFVEGRRAFMEKRRPVFRGV
jgi:enoyl-CoA hydratase/carnithine racemase